MGCAMGFAFFYLILCVVAGMAASSRGHSGVGFFLLSLIVSPVIGLILALVIQPGGMRVCPNCAEKVKAEAKLCKHCGNALPPPERESVAPPKDPTKERQDNFRAFILLIIILGVAIIIVLLRN